jgi:hypothetical protein
MNNKMRSILRIVAVLLVLLAVLMELNIVIIPALVSIRFWLAVIGFGLMLVSSR